MKIPRMPETTVSFSGGSYTIHQEYDYRVVDVVIPAYALPELLRQMEQARAEVRIPRSDESILEL